ncbi:MAG: hypothetical protein IIC06_00825 [Proteobacteria bacterium]|nr:hypothetical protein [Pseudomonadota bacterium]
MQNEKILINRFTPLAPLPTLVNAMAVPNPAPGAPNSVVKNKFFLNQLVKDSEKGGEIGRKRKNKHIQKSVNIN